MSEFKIVRRGYASKLKDLEPYITSLENQRDEAKAEATRWRGIADNLVDYTAHQSECIRSFWEAGEPTEGGGYRTKIAGKWYQSKPVNEEPKCNCGLDEIVDLYEAAKK